MLAALAAGFAAATLKTARVAHGVLARPMFSVTMKGFVETLWLDPSADGCTVFSLHGDQLMPILHTRKSSGGYSATRNCGVRLDESYFLPGGRQALLSVDTLQHEGLLVIDTEDGRHGLAPEGLEVYFPLHTRNVKRVAMGQTGPEVEVGLDFEALQPRLSRATAPSGGSR